MSTLRTALACLAAAVLLVPSASSARIFFSAPGASGGKAYPAGPTLLYAIDEDGTNFVELGTLSEAIGALAVNAAGDLYAFTFVPGIGSTLVTVDLDTLAVAPVGAGTPIAAQVTGAAFDRNGRLWTVVVQEGGDLNTAGILDLAEFDLATLALTTNRFSIPSPDANGGDVAFGLDGQCWFIGTRPDNTGTTRSVPLLRVMSTRAPSRTSGSRRPADSTAATASGPPGSPSL